LCKKKNSLHPNKTKKSIDEEEVEGFDEEVKKEKKEAKRLQM
jgi:hypothetical protein